MERKIEGGILTSVFILVAGCFSIPIIIFATSSQDSTSDSVVIEILADQFNVNDCSQQPITNSTVVESTYSEDCSQYEGICTIHLKHFQTLNYSLIVSINSAITEQQLSTLFSYALEDYSSLISDECLVAVIPFICQYVYPPCDGNGTANFITQEQCISVRDEVCVSEWRFLMAARVGSLLPICETIGSDNNNNSQSNEVSEPLKCHYQFKEFCGVCLPLCGTFSQYTAGVRISEDIVIITSSILAIIGGVIVLIVAAIKRKEMSNLFNCRLIFPQVLAMYTTANVLLLVVFILITYIGGQEELLCSHEALHLALLKPTVYTQITGFVQHFSLLCATLMWFLHLFHLFLAIAFPFWSKFLSEQKWKIRLHILEVLGCVVISSIAPITFLSVSEYVIARLPPLFVRPSRDVTFYSLILPTTILVGTGVNLTIYSFITIRKKVGLHKRGKACLVFFSVPEVKILIMLSYYIVFGVIQLVNTTISVNEATPFQDDLYKYFECQLTGYDPVCENIRRQFEKHLKPELNALSYALFASITWVNLLFAISKEDVKWLIQKVTSCYHYLAVKVPLHQGAGSSNGTISSKSATNPLALT